MNRQDLMRTIQMYDFYLIDLKLYLDTHPCDRDALSLFRENKSRRDSAVRAFTERFGPITADDAARSGRFTWTDDPWPWERSAN